MLAELVNELVHLEGGSDGLDEASGADATTAKTNVVLSHAEDVVPQTGLEVVLRRSIAVSAQFASCYVAYTKRAHLHLGKVEVGTVSSGDGLLGVVEEVETKVEDTSTQVLSVNSDVRLVQVPSSSTKSRGARGWVSVGERRPLAVARATHRTRS